MCMHPIAPERRHRLPCPHCDCRNPRTSLSWFLFSILQGWLTGGCAPVRRLWVRGMRGALLDGGGLPPPLPVRAPPAGLPSADYRPHRRALLRPFLTPRATLPSTHAVRASGWSLVQTDVNAGTTTRTISQTLHSSDAVDE